MFGIYWDCDGTLMDTEKAFAYAWQEILKSKNLDLPIAVSYTHLTLPTKRIV